MAKKQPPEEQPDDEKRQKRYSVVIDSDLVKKIKFLAADEGVSPPDWINNRVRKVVREEWPRILEQLTPDEE